MHQINEPVYYKEACSVFNEQLKQEIQIYILNLDIIPQALTADCMNFRINLETLTAKVSSILDNPF